AEVARRDGEAPALAEDAVRADPAHERRVVLEYPGVALIGDVDVSRGVDRDASRAAEARRAHAARAARAEGAAGPLTEDAVRGDAAHPWRVVLEDPGVVPIGDVQVARKIGHHSGRLAEARRAHPAQIARRGREAASLPEDAIGRPVGRERRLVLENSRDGLLGDVQVAPRIAGDPTRRAQAPRAAATRGARPRPAIC